ncbi:MAG: hypothetical protein ACK50V_00965 [Alphaproteobacteria bacterium]
MLTSGLLMAETGGLPQDFNHQEYLSLHQDLQDHVTKNNLDAKSFAEGHFVNHGQQEGRQYKSIDSQLPADFNWQNYLMLNADLRQHLTENPQFNDERFAKEHYVKHGKAEHRFYKVADKIAELTKKVEEAEKQKNYTEETTHQLSEEIESVMRIKILTYEQRKAIEALDEKVITLIRRFKLRI